MYSVVSGQIDPFTSSSSIEVRNLNAVRNDDTLTLTATLKNSGQTSITSVFISEITVSDLTITQDDKTGIVSVKKTGGTAKTFAASGAANNAAYNTTLDRNDGFSVVTAVSGTTYTIDESVLEGGRSNALVLKFTSTTEPDVSADVNISDKLNIVLKFKSGDDELLTEVFTTRVKPG